jgi:hypothetical protein
MAIGTVGLMLKLNQKKYIFGLAVVGANVAALTLPLVSQADTQSTTTTVNLSVNSVIISYSSGPTVTLGAITPDATGRQSTASDSVTANTNDTAGLTVTLQSNTGSTNMASGGNTIATGTGTAASPATLPNNRWGWRIDSFSGFGAGPTSVISSAAPSSLTYAGLPASGSPVTIHTTATNGSTSRTVWYSARVDNTQPLGSYSAVVLYTITTNT